MTFSEDSNIEQDPGLIDLATSNNDLKCKITNIIENIENVDPIELEEQVVAMLSNMMNFFSNYVEEIPNFNSLTPEQQQIIIQKFKVVSAELKKGKIKSINKMVQVSVFTVLSGLSENIEALKELTAEEILHKKHKREFRSFLKHAADFEMSQIINQKQIQSQGNFISESVKLGVKEALKNLKIDFNMEKMDKEALKILEDAHKALKQSQRQI